jgi:26S proteasome regulatory subunit T2
MRVGRKQRK